MSKIDRAKDELENQGYFVHSLWNVDDVQKRYCCSEQQAYDLLHSTLTNDVVNQNIWDSMEKIAGAMKIKKL